MALRRWRLGSEAEEDPHTSVVLDLHVSSTVTVLPAIAMWEKNKFPCPLKRHRKSDEV